MSITVSGSYIFVNPGDKCYNIASNFVNYFEIGLPINNEYYLEGKIDNDEFIINAKIFIPDKKTFGQIVNNIPQPAEWNRKLMPNGFSITDNNGNNILTAIFNSNICTLRTVIQKADGTIIAHDDGDNFVVTQGPLVLGKSGGARGIVVGE